MRKLLIFLLTGLMVVGVLILIPVALDVLGVGTVLANPKECPPGQEKKNGCKWVQHIVTGHCQWLPEQAVANPWHEIPEGTCPELDPTLTPFQPVVITWTPVLKPTGTHRPTQTSVSSPDPSKTAKPIATDKPAVPTVPALPVATGGACEDTCDPLWALAHAEQTKAALEVRIFELTATAGAKINQP